VLPGGPRVRGGDADPPAAMRRDAELEAAAAVADAADPDPLREESA
jgi:hypothetical protein